MAGSEKSGEKKYQHVHILGVCGTLMGAFAAYLKRAGIRVTGSDQNVYPPMSEVLKAAGVELFSPYSAENLQKIGQPDLTVIGNVISRGNVEMVALQERGDVYVSLPEFMEQNLLPQTCNLVVAGTHGKTTTSSLLAYTLQQCQQVPSYFIGGVSHDLPHSFHVEAQAKYFVLEGDEYDTAYWDKVPKFNHYLPDRVILTSVEFDHADIYKDLEAVMHAFRGLFSRIRAGGKVIACIETENVRQLINESKVPVMTYSRHAADQADYMISGLHQNAVDCLSFEVLKKAADGTYQRIETLELQLSGEHNALNALAVYLQCLELGNTSAAIKAGLKKFHGIKRRQEVRGEVREVLVIDDFAHHPTAVKETLSALKMKYPQRRLMAVFEPRSATSRRKVFQQAYTEAFDEADVALIAVAFDAGKIPADQQFSSQELVQGLQQRWQGQANKQADFFASADAGVKRVTELARPGDLVAVLSNGGFDGFIVKLLAAL